MDYFGIAENCGSGQVNCGKTIAKSREQRRGPLFYRGKDGFGWAVINKGKWSKLGVPRLVAFHWLNCNGLSLAGLLPGQEENLPLMGYSCSKSSVVHLFWFGSAIVREL